MPGAMGGWERCGGEELGWQRGLERWRSGRCSFVPGFVGFFGSFSLCAGTGADGAAGPTILSPSSTAPPLPLRFLTHLAARRAPSRNPFSGFLPLLLIPPRTTAKATIYDDPRALTPSSSGSLHVFIDRLSRDPQRQLRLPFDLPQALLSRPPKRYGRSADGSER